MKNKIATTKDMREQLKSIMESEILKLPELLKGLEPMERINCIIKLMPFIYPKVENVNASSGEGLEFDLL